MMTPAERKAAPAFAALIRKRLCEPSSAYRATITSRTPYQQGIYIALEEVLALLREVEAGETPR